MYGHENFLGSLVVCLCTFPFTQRQLKRKKCTIANARAQFVSKRTHAHSGPVVSSSEPHWPRLPRWRHQMEPFPVLLAFCTGNSPVTGEFPSQRPVTRSFDVFFDLNGWVNNREAGDLRRHRAYYDAILMVLWDGLCGVWGKRAGEHGLQWPLFTKETNASSATTWWRHQVGTFSALLAICAGNSPVPVNSPHKGQWRGALMFSLIWAWINVWVNNGEAGDLRRHRAHYDVIVMNAKEIQ